MLDIFLLKIYNLSAETLTPMQKLKALKRFHGGEGMADIRVFIAGLVLIAVLLIVLALYRKSRAWQNEEDSKKAFEENVERLNFDSIERQLLLDMAKYSKLKKIDSIFTMPQAFDLGSATLMKRSFSAGKSLVERKHLNQQIISLKEKLGFKKKHYSYSSNENSFGPKGLSSRQIPVGRSVLISRIHSKEASPMSAKIIENNHFELKLSTSEAFKGKPGEIWRVLYQLGSVIWKFDSLVVSCEENELLLSHTENIRYINRRRFVHAPVNLHGYVAGFPCVRTVEDIQRDFLPQFIAARITELSGPGLQIIAPMKVRTGERIMVIFELSPNRLVQSAAEVRRCEPNEEGFAISVEMVDINESCLNELISATNNAARELVSEQQQAEAQQETLQNS